MKGAAGGSLLLPVEIHMHEKVSAAPSTTSPVAVVRSAALPLLLSPIVPNLFLVLAIVLAHPGAAEATFVNDLAEPEPTTSYTNIDTDSCQSCQQCPSTPMLVWGVTT